MCSRSGWGTLLLLCSILWWFLPYINMNWPQVYMCPPPSWIPLPPPSLLYPSGLSQSTGFGCPDSCIKLTLAIYFTNGNGHVSMLFSEITPPRLLLLNQKVRCLHLCLLCCSHHSKILYDPPPRVMEIK